MFNIVYSAVQMYLFGNNDYIEIKDIEDLADCGNAKARKYANNLCEMNILKKISQKSIRLVLEAGYIS